MTEAAQRPASEHAADEPDLRALVARILDRPGGDGAGHDRIVLLLSAARTVTRELDLAQALQRIVEVARELVGADCGAQVVITITDDGIGMPSGGRRNGLENLRARAVERGGTFSVGPASPRGTQVRWVVPWKTS